MMCQYKVHMSIRGSTTLIITRGFLRAVPYLRNEALPMKEYFKSRVKFFGAVPYGLIENPRGTEY